MVFLVFFITIFVGFSNLYGSDSSSFLTRKAELQVICRENPTDIQAWINLGILFLQNNLPNEAQQAYQKALDLDQANPNSWFHMANCLLAQDDAQQASEIYKEILSISHAEATVWHNLGYAYKKLGQPENARMAFEYALAYKLDCPGNHLTYGLMALALGDFENGWREYEWRRTTALQPITFPQIARWDGSSLKDKTIVVTAEQGFGDTFQFIRYLKLFKKQGATIIFRAQPTTMAIALLCPYIDKVLNKNDPFEENADFHVSLLSIPYLCKTRLESIPAEIPYLQTNPERDAFWKDRLKDDHNFKIGLCWHGNDLFATADYRTTATHKSIPLQFLTPLFQIPNVSVYSLQKMTDEIAQEINEANLPIITFDESFDRDHGRFIDSASLIKQLDLIISVDTSIAHLAGGLGVSTFVPLSFVPDWRWMYNRNDSPWYPTMKLFRQKTFKDWTDPLDQIMQEIIQ